MTAERTRIVIIGGGPGGYEAALVAAQLGADVTVVERDGAGGACVLTDCVPSKTLIATSVTMATLAGAANLGVRAGAAAGAVGVLFARSYARAEAIHLAMLARGFAGHFRPLAKSSFRKLDAAFLAGAVAAIVLLRAAIEVWT